MPRLQLYNDSRKPEPPTRPRGGLARLRAISYTDGQGWRFVFDGPFGPQRYLGWLVETARAPRPVSVSTSLDVTSPADAARLRA